MKNINWSKWIAIALSIFIVTQFIQVSFLAARQVGGGQANAGADASRGSIAEEVYAGVMEKAAGSDLILEAKAGDVTTSVTPALTSITVGEDTITDGDLTGKTSAAINAGFDMVVTITANAALAQDDTITINVPTGLTAAGVNVTSGSASAGLASNVITVTVGSGGVASSGTIGLNITGATATLSPTATTSISFCGTNIQFPKQTFSPTIALTLADSSGTAITGDVTAARFSVTGTNNSLSGQSGATLTLANFEAGDYTLTETTAPNSGYARNTTSFAFSISNTGTITVTSAPAGTAGEWTTVDAAALTIKHVVATFSPSITLLLKNSEGGDLTGTTTAARFAVAGTNNSLSDQSGSLLTLTNFEAGDYTLTETTEPNSGYARNTTSFAFSISNTGTITVTSTPAETAGVWSGLNSANATLTIKHAASSPAVVTGTIKVTRKTKLSSSAGSALNLSGVKYRLYEADKQTQVGAEQTTANTEQSVAFSNLSIADGTGTKYYLKETLTPNCHAAPTVKKIKTGTTATAFTGEPSDDVTLSEGFYEITLTRTAEAAHVSLLGYYQVHTLELVETGGTHPSTENITITAMHGGDKFGKNIDGSAVGDDTSTITWATASTPTSCYGTFINGGTYRLTVPDSAGFDQTITFTLAADGTINAPTFSDSTKVSAARTNGNMGLTITRVVTVTPGTLQVQIADADNGNAAITASGVKYWYGTCADTTPTTDEVNAAKAIASHQLTTDSTGKFSLTLTPGASPTKYFLVEDGTAGAPTGYTANGTSEYYTLFWEPDRPGLVPLVGTGQTARVR